MGGGGLGFVGDLVSGITLGTVDLNKEKQAKVKTTTVQQLEEDKKDNSHKRKALYATSGGALGQEVSRVGNTSRGSLFGN